MLSGDRDLVLLTGAYGHGNLGDDLLGILTAAELREQGHEVALAAGSDSRVPADLPQSRKVLIGELGPRRTLLLGGGGLFNDAWASDYSRYFASLALAARLRRARACAAGLGIEAPRSAVGHACLALAGRTLAPFGVRDPASAAILTRHRARRVEVGIDLGWLAAGRLQHHPQPEPGLVSVTIAGETPQAARARVELLGAALTELLEAGVVQRIRGVVMQCAEARDVHDDRALLAQLAQRVAHPLEIVVPDDPWEAFAALAPAPLSVGFRLHGLLLAYLAGAHVIALSRSQKVSTTFAGAPGADILQERQATPAAILALARTGAPAPALRREHALAAREIAARHLARVVDSP